MKKRILVKDVLDAYNEAAIVYQKMIKKIPSIGMYEPGSLFHHVTIQKYWKLKKQVEELKNSKNGVYRNKYYNQHTKAKMFLPTVKKQSAILKERCYLLLPELARKEKLKKLNQGKSEK